MYLVMPFSSLIVPEGKTHKDCKRFCMQHKTRVSLEDDSTSERSELESRNCTKAIEEYITPFKYCDVEDVNPRRITGVRHHGLETKPNCIEVLHEEASRILHGNLLLQEEDQPSYDRPYIPDFVDPAQIQKTKDRKAKSKAKALKKAKKSEEEMLKRVLKAIREEDFDVTSE